METLRSWALTVALSALAGGIVWLLAPKGSVQKAVRMVVAVFLLSAFLTPVLRAGSINWELPEALPPPSIAGFDEVVSKQLQAAVEEEIRGRYARILEARGLAGQIDLRTDILSDGSINIASAKVIVPFGSDTAGLREELGAAAGLDVEVIVE